MDKSKAHLKNQFFATNFRYFFGYINLLKIKNLFFYSILLLANLQDQITLHLNHYATDLNQ